MLESARDADLRVRMPRLPPASEPARAPAVGGAPADVPALWWLRALAPDVPLRHREIGGGPARFAGRLVELRRPRRGQPGERRQVHEEDGAGVRGRSRRRFRVRHGRGDGRGRGRRGARRRIHGRLGSVRSIVKVQAHDSFDAVGASAWDGLVAATRLRSPFLSWTWQHEWAQAFAPTRRLEIRVVQDDGGHLVAILPLYEDSPGVLRMIGGADVSDYLDLIAVEGREEEAWTALLQSRGTERVEWRLHAVPGASATVVALPQLASASGVAATASVEERCPVLALPRSWDTYLASLSGKHRHELQRKMRRLEREAPEARVSSAGDPAEVGARLSQFLVLHRRSRVGKACFMDERMVGFFRRG